MTQDRAREALAKIALPTSIIADDIWRDDCPHIEGLHGEAWDEVVFKLGHLHEAERTDGLCIQGRPGLGKSHFLGRLRAHVLAQGDLFILAEMSSSSDFWPSLMTKYRESLFRDIGDGMPQASKLLGAVARSARLPSETIAKIEHRSLSAQELFALREPLQHIFRNQPHAYAVAFALLLTGLQEEGTYDIGMQVLQAMPLPRKLCSSFRFHQTSIAPEDIIAAYDWILEKADLNAVIAIDQVDALIAAASKDGDEKGLLDRTASGLMDLVIKAPHHLTVLSCLPTTWQLIADRAVQSAAHRFTPIFFDGISSVETGGALIAAHFAPGYRKAGWAPDYPYWPVEDSDIEGLLEASPRDLLKMAETKVRRKRKELAPCLVTAKEPASSPFPDFNQVFQASFDAAQTQTILDERWIDQALPPLLLEGLRAFILENGLQERCKLDPPPGPDPSLHARLREELDPAQESETHWSFRAIPHAHGNAALKRLRNAYTESGIEIDPKLRKLIILRNGPFSNGAKTQAQFNKLVQAGGQVAQITPEDLRTFQALADLWERFGDDLIPWLRENRPASRTALLSKALAPLLSNQTPAQPQEPASCETPKKSTGPATMQIGLSQETRASLSLPLETLRRHAILFAGSGSGKTVLIRRLVEECALQGVSAIVLDPNNDLARLGDRWPKLPDQWTLGDAEKANRYFEDVETIVWTPRLNRGRPLSFHPLGDLAAFRDDPEELRQAVEAAVDALMPRAGLANSQRQQTQGQAVLTEALLSFAKNGGTDLRPFLDYLSDLPEGVCQLSDAQRLGKAMADTLIAATVTDPLFGGEGEPVDPTALFTPTPGKKARISVISLAGLTSDGQRQNFVNQLQLALFAWAKKHPAGDKPLGGLYVMDEAQNFVPSGAATPSTKSTLALASQARKFGLGLIFATQAPKGLHNQVPGNATTQFFGLMNAPAQISAVQELARQKGGDITDISMLHTGEFYVASESIALQKIQAPLCLSHHPSSPLTQEQIVTLAANKGGER